ncbi:hypothetical protein [Variovorax sp. WS11]|uniref:hypothetical protein n=1 Tax=Variovorax sp. WS11 TaxID=1105204 RepID=UPI0011B20B34|nr:hypothetical protein [Variovorax sp. WS11]NDZ12782.1 hypothetical protein [Variovorax sp. WS11]
MFQLGRVCVSEPARLALHHADVPLGDLLMRHQHGDWGRIDALDVRQNALGLRLGLRLRSSYTLRANPPDPDASVTVWVITTPNRKTTTVFLPREIFDDTSNDHND